MAQEIERKFLVIGEFKSSAFAQSHIVQGSVSYTHLTLPTIDPV